ncbi:MAG: hypothetical protein [Cressdnaviricota sp.]|nr:MAG: hypothetical protein [Cressdnaviricota sp.]
MEVPSGLRHIGSSRLESPKDTVAIAISNGVRKFSITRCFPHCIAFLMRYGTKPSCGQVDKYNRARTSSSNGDFWLTNVGTLSMVGYPVPIDIAISLFEIIDILRCQ